MQLRRGGLLHPPGGDVHVSAIRAFGGAGLVFARDLELARCGLHPVAGAPLLAYDGA